MSALRPPYPRYSAIMDAAERRRALAGGRVPGFVRWSLAVGTLLVLLGVSYFVASFIVFDLRHWMVSNVPLLVVSVLIGAVGIGTARRIFDRSWLSPWLAAALVVPAVAAVL